MKKLMLVAVCLFILTNVAQADPARDIALVVGEHINQEGRPVSLTGAAGSPGSKVAIEAGYYYASVEGDGFEGQANTPILDAIVPIGQIQENSLYSGIAILGLQQMGTYDGDIDTDDGPVKLKTDISATAIVLVGFIGINDSLIIGADISIYQDAYTENLSDQSDELEIEYSGAYNVPGFSIAYRLKPTVELLAGLNLEGKSENNSADFTLNGDKEKVEDYYSNGSPTDIWISAAFFPESAGNLAIYTGLAHENELTLEEGDTEEKYEPANLVGLGLEYGLKAESATLYLRGSFGYENAGDDGSTIALGCGLGVNYDPIEFGIGYQRENLTRDKDEGGDMTFNHIVVSAGVLF